jgi:hypothetical protein
MVSRDGNTLPAQIYFGNFLPGHYEGAASFSQCSSGSKERIVIPQMSEGMKGYFCDIQFMPGSQPVQGLDIFQPLSKRVSLHGNLFVDKGIKNERVIRTRRITQ